MTTTEFTSAPVADKHLAWIANVLAKTSFSEAYANATIDVKFERIKGEPLDTFVTFTLADGTVTTLSTGSGKGNLNGTLAKWSDTRTAFRALVAPAKPAAAPAETPVAEAAAPAKPKKAAKRVKKAKPAEIPPEQVEAAIAKVYEDAKDIPFMPDPDELDA